MFRQSSNAASLFSVLMAALIFSLCLAGVAAAQARPSSCSGSVGNTSLGTNALINNTTGRNNTAIGVATLAANTTGRNNTAIGDTTLAANTTGNGNTAIGFQALVTNTTGVQNTASGGGAL